MLNHRIRHSGVQFLSPLGAWMSESMTELFYPDEYKQTIKTLMR